MTVPPEIAAPPPVPLFCAQGLHKRFGGVHAVRDLSLTVSTAAIFAIIGPNGAGKSTLLNLMSGLYQPDAGHMTLDGRDLSGVPAHRRARLGLARTFQKIRLFRHLTVLANVVAAFHIHHSIPAWQYVFHSGAFARESRALPRRGDGAPCLRRTRRTRVRASCFTPYGEQRMLELARALATGPRLLLVDEPAAGLNAVEVERLIERIHLLRERGMTVIVVEHNMDLVMGIADRVMVMDYGRYLFEGTPSQVQANPAVIAAYLGV